MCNFCRIILILKEITTSFLLKNCVQLLLFTAGSPFPSPRSQLFKISKICLQKTVTYINMHCEYISGLIFCCVRWFNASLFQLAVESDGAQSRRASPFPTFWRLLVTTGGLLAWNFSSGHVTSQVAVLAMPMVVHYVFIWVAQITVIWR